MGMIITVVLAVIIFGFGLGLAFKALKKEVVEGACASCGPDKSCCSKGKPVDITSEFK